MSLIRYGKNIGHHLNALLAVFWYGYPAKNLTVIGVTGTDGKTTTSTLIYSILKTAKYKVALISTVAAYIGDTHIDTGFHVTSPTPWSVQRLLKKIQQEGYTHVVLEATSHGLDQHRLTGIKPFISVLTNVTLEHLDYHKTYERYLKAKAKLLKHSNQVVLNKDDRSYSLMLEQVSNKPESQIFSYSLAQAPAYFDTLFAEEYNRANAQAARTVALRLGVSDAVIEQGLKSFSGIPGRMEEIPNQRGFRTLVDFAHTPNGLEQSLTALRKTTKGRLIAVYGSAGLRDYAKRPLMGEIGTRIANYVVLTSEDPRTEKAESIIYQMKQGVVQGHKKITSIVDRGKAIDFAINVLAKKGDVVVALGKGHEASMNLDGKQEMPWSDQEAMRRSLANAS